MEGVEAWWARRQVVLETDVPYPVGTYRDAWAPYPTLIRQYHPDLNAGITLTQIPPAAEVLLLWQCDAGHLFAATPTEQRARPGRERRRSSWCPECLALAKPPRVRPAGEARPRTASKPSPCARRRRACPSATRSQRMRAGHRIRCRGAAAARPRRAPRIHGRPQRRAGGAPVLRASRGVARHRHPRVAHCCRVRQHRPAPPEHVGGVRMPTSARTARCGGRAGRSCASAPGASSRSDPGTSRCRARGADCRRACSRCSGRSGDS